MWYWKEHKTWEILNWFTWIAGGDLFQPHALCSNTCRFGFHNAQLHVWTYLTCSVISCCLTFGLYYLLCTQLFITQVFVEIVIIIMQWTLILSLSRQNLICWGRFSCHILGDRHCDLLYNANKYCWHLNHSNLHLTFHPVWTN